jgi:hypothetical protein
MGSSHVTICFSLFSCPCIATVSIYHIRFLCITKTNKSCSVRGKCSLCRDYSSNPSRCIFYISLARRRMKKLVLYNSNDNDNDFRLSVSIGAKRPCERIIGG